MNHKLHRCWWQVDVDDFMLVTIFVCWWQNFDVGAIFRMLVPDAIVKRKRIFEKILLSKLILKICSRHFQYVLRVLEVVHGLRGTFLSNQNDHMTRLDDFIDEKLKDVTFSKMVRRWRGFQRAEKGLLWDMISTLGYCREVGNHPIDTKKLFGKPET